MIPATWDDMTPHALFDLLTKEGRSYGDLAKHYGVSRNTVSGQVYRWRQSNAFPANLPAMSKNKNATPAEKVLNGPYVRKPKTQSKAKAKTKTKVQAGDPVVRKRETAVEPPTNPPVGIIDLENGMCAVVVSESPLLYCGCKPLKNHKFRMCAYHDSTMLTEPKVHIRNR